MDDATRQWRQAERAALCLAAGGAKLGGAVVHARYGPVRDAWLEGLKSAIAPNKPWRKIPSHCPAEQLQGGIDLAATLHRGEPIHSPGLLAKAKGGVTELAMAERAEAHLAASLAQQLEQSAVTLIAIAENEADEPGVPASLAHRLAFYIDLTALPHRATEPFGFDAGTLEGVAGQAAHVDIDDQTIEAIAATSLAFGVDSMRPALWALKVVRILAAYDGLDSPDQAVIAEACALTLSHRATQLPAQPQDEDSPDPPPPPGETKSDQPRNQETGEIEDKLIDAVKAEIPADLLTSLLQAGRSRQKGLSGSAGQWQKPAKRGRPIGLRPGSLKSGSRIDLVATLTAAAPWQPWRRKFLRKGRKAPPILVEEQDLRIKSFKERRGTVMIFAVDASGSAALNRLGEAKGAVELILAQCYVRRDEAALIAFRQQEASLLLPPTRSLTRAKRLLQALPGGGGTPLASALRASVQLACQARRKGQTPFFVLISDGRGNIDLQGHADKAQARADMDHWAREIARAGIASIVIDTSSRKQQARMTPGPGLAQAMGARYHVLPMADAGTLAQTIQREVDHV